jgi:hypothetical protein
MLRPEELFPIYMKYSLITRCTLLYLLSKCVASGLWCVVCLLLVCLAVRVMRFLRASNEFVFCVCRVLSVGWCNIVRCVSGDVLYCVVVCRRVLLCCCVFCVLCIIVLLRVLVYAVVLCDVVC